MADAATSSLVDGITARLQIDQQRMGVEEFTLVLVDKRLLGWVWKKCRSCVSNKGCVFWEGGGRQWC